MGDYPLIRGDQTLFFIFNDQKVHNETAGAAPGMEVHGMAYGFDNPSDPWLDNAIFLSYKVFNRSNMDLHDVFMGLFSDFDLGYAWDDYIGCDVGRGAYFAYDSDEYDEVYGFYPPAQGIIVLGGPYMDPDGDDNPSGGCDESINGVGFGDGVVDNERYGMRNFLYFNNSTAAMGDPQVADEYYTYLQGVWLDGSPMLYGGNGHTSSGAYGPGCDFMFPGLSDPCNWGTGQQPPNGPVNWTEESAGNDPSDRRGVCSMGPFSFGAGGFHKVDIAFITARGDSVVSSVELLKTYIDSVKTFYCEDPDHFGYAWLDYGENTAKEHNLVIYPNPVGPELFIKVDEPAGKCIYKIFDITGKLVLEGSLSDSSENRITTRHLDRGVYLLHLETENGSYTARFVK